MITTSVRGHLASQDFSPEYGWSKCDPVALFEAPIQTLYREDLRPLERMLHRLARTCQVLILWLDCDREGEAIGHEVRTVCLQSNPRLSVYRARFSTVLEAEIRRALQTLGRLNEHFVHAVQTRSELDLRVGAAFTRFQTLRLQRNFEGFSDTQKGVVSYGPCQFPTLGFVVERWARIQTFVPEEFWYIEMSVNVDAATGMGTNESNNSNKSIHFTWKRGRLYDPVATAFFYESCLDAGEAVVTHLTGRPKNKWRPVPLATVELQKRASRYLRLGAEQLMSAAEELYHQGLISYPRTETEKFRPEFEHRPLIEQFLNVPGEFADYAQKLLQQNAFQMPRAGQHDDQAHPPISPCKAIDPNTIENPINRGVYSLVVKHYLACCSRDAVGRETQLAVRMDSEEFTATGLMVLEKNWLEIYHPWERWSTGQGELPALEIGSRLQPSSLLMKSGRTTPPDPISEVELITMMDRNGIGTDATIAQHITTIQDREYATKDASMKFLPTRLGIALIEAYNSMGYQLNKPDLRRETEAECNLIAEGRKTKDQVMAVLLAKMRQCYEAATQEAHKLDEAVSRHFPRLGTNDATSQVVDARFSLCGVCNNAMVLKQDRNGRGNNAPRKVAYCNTCRRGWGLPRGTCRPKVQDGNGGGPVKCPICNFQVVQVLPGEGYTGNGYHVCPKCFGEPPAEFGGSANGGDFRCFSCQHPTCTLAGGTASNDVPVFSCPFCNQGQVCLRKNSRGFVLSCNTYSQGDRCPYTIWLPKECQTVSIPPSDENVNTLCGRCSTAGAPVRRVSFVWKAGSVPPHYGRESTVCVLCDVDLRRDFSIVLPQRDQVAIRRHAPPQRGEAAGRTGGRGTRGGTARGRGGQGSGRTNVPTNGSTACFKCGEPGHFANRCPNA